MSLQIIVHAFTVYHSLLERTLHRNGIPSHSLESKQSTQIWMSCISLPGTEAHVWVWGRASPNLAQIFILEYTFNFLVEYYFLDFMLEFPPVCKENLLIQHQCEYVEFQVLSFDTPYVNPSSTSVAYPCSTCSSACDHHIPKPFAFTIRK